MLDQVPPSRTARRNVGQQLLNQVQLMIARKYLFFTLPARPLVLRFDHLCVVLNDLREAPASKHIAPEVVCLQPIGVRRIPRTVVEPLIEGEKPRRLALKMRAETNLLVVHGKVNEASAELK